MPTLLWRSMWDSHLFTGLIENLWKSQSILSSPLRLFRWAGAHICASLCLCDILVQHLRLYLLPHSKPRSYKRSFWFPITYNLEQTASNFSTCTHHRTPGGVLRFFTWTIMCAYYISWDSRRHLLRFWRWNLSNIKDVLSSHLLLLLQPSYLISWVMYLSLLPFSCDMI